ncbi:mitochondrial carrier [Lasallia pustulata]|uniref:Mitochondrial thiamine pyrophosphate carrier 1 n=1 Tax=Lasallia pustulata TaxID=136370 RepID=A0A1W5DB24_9LECA|nr:mitochondrial carrier [Lasallia pustulata]
MEAESQNARDKRVEKLWQDLDTRKEGQLDIKALKKGLRKIDHPLKNADGMLQDVFKAVDLSGDGRIQYSEFRTFVEQTEKELQQLFKSIDRDHNGQLDKGELKSAFARAGLVVPQSKFDQFFAEVDSNHDGVITFDEWRNFLLFIPAHAPGLKAVLSYYSSTVTVNSEGDVQVSDETVEGLGYFLAGGIAGVVSRTATAPLDRLKVYLIAQTSVRDETVHAVKSGAPVEAAKKASRPLIEATRTLWRMGGMRSLFAGNGLNVLKVMPESAIKFGSYEGSKRALARLEGHSDPKALNPWSQFLAAGLGGIISQFCIYPLDTLKFRMQCETVQGGLHGNRLIVATAKKMWSSSGIRSFYRGLPMGLVGMFPYSALDLTTFEYLKRFITARNAKARHCHEEDAAPGNVMTAGIGAFSGALGASAVYPINVLRTRLQSQGTAIHPPTYTGIWDVTVKTVRGEGVRGLFKGITPNLLKVVPAVSITYVVYDNSKRALGLR